MSGQLTAEDLRIRELLAELSDPGTLGRLADICAARAQQLGPTLDRVDLSARRRNRVEGAIEALGWVAGICEARFLEIRDARTTPEQGAGT